MHTMPSKNRFECYLTPAQAASVLHISVGTLKKFIYTGRLRTLKTPGGHHRILKRHLYALAKEEAALSPPVVAEDKTTLVIAGGLVAALEKEHPFCKGHARCVADVSLSIAERLGMADVRIQALEAAALLHDIGMLDIDRDIMAKKEPPTVKETALIRTHPTLGAQIAESIRVLRPLAHFILLHHERCDGTGYPLGLSADAICLEARIIAVSEAYIAMTRPHYNKKPLPAREARERLIAGAGSQFDPAIVHACTQLMRQESGRED